MARDIVNFNAGPAGLPTEVLEQAKAELLDYQGTGMSIMEHSHRGKAYDAVHHEALELIKNLAGVPDTHAIFFMQGGASGMFATVPYNFLTPGKVADYVMTGVWSDKALQEAQAIGNARAAGHGKRDDQYVRVPTQDELDLTGDGAYVHITTNNTISGTQFHQIPHTKTPLIADMSSDIMSRPVDVSQYALIYAGAQKNLGPSGVVLGIIDKAFMESASKQIPKIVRFATHVQKDSLYHTPPTFAIYLVGKVLHWIKNHGGLEGMKTRNETKAQLLYQAIDDGNPFYRSPVDKTDRSQMNVVWRLPSEDLEQRFIAEATDKGLVGLKGHRSVGGIRASIYNAVSPEGVERLVDFMKAFRQTHG